MPDDQCWIEVNCESSIVHYEDDFLCFVEMLVAGESIGVVAIAADEAEE